MNPKWQVTTLRFIYLDEGVDVHVADGKVIKVSPVSQEVRDYFLSATRATGRTPSNDDNEGDQAHP
jgi:hypothetical protein